MNLIKLQNKIYQQNKEMGWHDEPRCFSTFTNLFHSEVSEGLEGLRKGLNDDHLPDYPMLVVEAVDCQIRIMDYLGSIGATHEYQTASFGDLFDLQHSIAKTHWCISQAWAAFNSTKLRVNYLAAAFMECELIASHYGYKSVDIILEKVEYNKNRADHKRENRAKEGGKKF